MNEQEVKEQTEEQKPIDHEDLDRCLNELQQSIEELEEGQLCYV